MTAFQTTIRPFRQIGVTPPAKDPDAPPSQIVPNVVFTVGDGKAKQFSFSESLTETLYMAHKEKEKSRDVQNYRISQPGKPENFVDVGIAKNIKTKGVNGQENNYNYYFDANPPQGEGVIAPTGGVYTVTAPEGG